jgi:EAL domain-containing protein (putative c-di-GMP-specific phosphodiesterase class I)
VWRQRFHPDFQISINKSPVQFRSDRGQKTWAEQMRLLELPGSSVVVEITEGLLMDANEVVNAKLLQFRDAGIQVALDDFGTGYSSLSYLQRFDIDYIKIDQSFVRNLAPGSHDLALCEAIIVMAHKLNMKVIAEGVETPSQRDLLTAAGCDYAQGYLFARALPREAFEALVESATRSPVFNGHDTAI